MQKSTVIIIIVIIIAVVAVIGYYYKFYSEGYRTYYGSASAPNVPAHFATLGSYGYSDPLFEPDVLRRCASGAYMYTSNPALQSFCSTVPPQVLDRVACRPAFIGRPLHLEYTAPAYGTACQCRIPCGKPELGLNLS